MTRKKKPIVKLNPVTNNLSEPFDFNKKVKGYKFLNVLVEFGLRGIIINWVAQGIGFGQVSYVVLKNKVQRDSEGMGDDFCTALINEIEKIQDNKKIVKNMPGLKLDATRLVIYLKHLETICKK